MWRAMARARSSLSASNGSTSMMWSAMSSRCGCSSWPSLVSASWSSSQSRPSASNEPRFWTRIGATEVAPDEKLEDVAGYRPFRILVARTERFDVDDMVGDVLVDASLPAIGPRQAVLVCAGPEHDRRAGQDLLVSLAHVDRSCGRDHQCDIAREQICEDLCSPPAEIVLASLAGQPGEGTARDQLELLVGRGEGTLEEPGQVAADACGAGLRSADQDDVAVTVRAGAPRRLHTPRSRSRIPRLVSSSVTSWGSRSWPVKISNASMAWPRNRSKPVMRASPADAARTMRGVSMGE